MNYDLLAYGSSVVRLLNSIKTDLDRFFKTDIKARTEFYTETVLAEAGCPSNVQEQKRKYTDSRVQPCLPFMASREAVPEGEESEGLHFEDGFNSRANKSCRCIWH